MRSLRRAQFFPPARRIRIVSSAHPPIGRGAGGHDRVGERKQCYWTYPFRRPRWRPRMRFRDDTGRGPEAGRLPQLSVANGIRSQRGSSPGPRSRRLRARYDAWRGGSRIGWRAFHFFHNLLRRWVRWFKTTNAYRAQPATLRHKRALKALLGKAAEKAMGFMGRNRRPRAATIYRLVKHARHAGTQNWDRLRRRPRRSHPIITSIHAIQHLSGRTLTPLLVACTRSPCPPNAPRVRPIGTFREQCRSRR
jgi:hypothetical protein